MSEPVKKKPLIDEAVAEIMTLTKKVDELEAELMQDERFRTFLTTQKEAQKQIADTWKVIETQMIDNDIKSVKGDWGSITIAERTSYKVDLDTLPKKFIKKVADTTKIGQAHKLEGEPPKGAEPYITKYLTKRIK